MVPSNTNLNLITLSCADHHYDHEFDGFETTKQRKKVQGVIKEQANGVMTKIRAKKR